MSYEPPRSSRSSRLMASSPPRARRHLADDARALLEPCECRIAAESLCSRGEDEAFRQQALGTIDEPRFPAPDDPLDPAADARGVVAGRAGKRQLHSGRRSGEAGCVHQLGTAEAKPVGRVQRAEQRRGVGREIHHVLAAVEDERQRARRAVQVHEQRALVVRPHAGRGCMRSAAGESTDDRLVDPAGVKGEFAKLIGQRVASGDGPLTALDEATMRRVYRARPGRETGGRHP